MQNNFSFGHYGQIIIHTPHAGTELPMYFSCVKYVGIMPSYNAQRASIRNLFWQLTDHYTDKLFSFVSDGSNLLRPFGVYKRIEQISFKYSRLFCDVERMENDPLEEKGLGIHYDINRYIDEKAKPITWRFGKEKVMEIYNEHHNQLLFSVGTTKTLLLDCHSFSERDNILCPNAHEYKDIDICIGFNEDETKPSEEFILSVRNFFTACGYRVEFNKPFSNSKTLEGFCKEGNHQYHSLMIEVNKHCYMNEDTLEITAGYHKLHAELQQLYHLLLN
jgi:N-formylglutamate amidohydrolase